MKKYFEGMRGHEKFTMSLEISSGPPPGINNDCSLIHFIQQQQREIFSLKG
jgi:hypothetical protein